MAVNGASAGPPARRRSFLARHKVAAFLLALLLLLLGALAGFVVYVNQQLGDIATYESQLDPRDRPPRPTGRDAEALNLLVLGADNGTGTSIEADLADGRWNAGEHRSDTIMLLHLTADRDSAYVVSIPRDTYVPIDGHGRDKINAAFSYGGPDLAVQTVERLTGVRVDHVVILEWDGFKDITTALGGVEVCIPEPVTDPGHDIAWQPGCQTVEGQRALDYVRTRQGLPGGDLDRIKRQQNFLRETIGKLVDQGANANLVRLTNVLDVLTDHTTVDADFTPAKMRDLAWSLRSIRANDVVYLTAPFGGFDTTADGQSIVQLDRVESKALWRALRNDAVERYLARYGGDRLGSPSAVS